MENIFESELEAFESGFGSVDLVMPTESPEETTRRIDEINVDIRRAAAAEPARASHPRLGRSSVFIPGERVPDTLLTVVGPGYKNRWGEMTWKEITCLCDCGKQTNIAYAYLAHQPPKYSCGCARRPRQETLKAL